MDASGETQRHPISNANPPGTLPQDSPLIRGLSAQDVAHLGAMARVQLFPRGEYVFRRGEASEDLFIVGSGRVEIIKQEPVGGGTHAIMTLSPGASFGEGALHEGKVRSVSVRAATDCAVFALRAAELKALAQSEPRIIGQLKANLGEQLAKNLGELGDQTAKHLALQLAEANAKARAERFVVTTLLSICAYVFFLQIAVQLIHGKFSTSVVSIPGFVIFFFLFFRVARHSGQPLSHYGVTMTNWRSALLEAVVASIPIMLLAVWAKWMLIHYLPQMHGEAIFALLSHTGTAPAVNWIDAFAYLLFSPFQEFIVRGTMQGSLEDFLSGRHRVLKAILVANIMYAMLHLYMSVIFSAMVFVPGMIWGWLYSRHRTLVGVTASHALCGIFAFFVVGFDTLIQIYA